MELLKARAHTAAGARFAALLFAHARTAQLRLHVASAPQPRVLTAFCF
jgi:hypothetical protein